MRKPPRLKSILVGVLSLIALAAVPAASSAAPPANTTQWKVRNTASISAATSYELVNARGGQLGYTNRRLGVDLGFVGSSGGHFEFKRLNLRDHRRLRAGEKLALYNTKTRRYLFGAGQTFGINLNWTKSPSWEWRIELRQGSQTQFALYNTKVNDYLVYGSRTFGPNLKWYKDTLPKPEPPPQTVFSVALRRQIIVQGPIPYLGSFGSGLDPGVITRVKNTETTATLHFVKPGHSTQECTNPSAVVSVAPGATMTADQLKAAFGSTSPRVPIAFVACLSRPGPGLVDLAFIEIEFKRDA
jgi:hypothetical protein